MAGGKVRVNPSSPSAPARLSTHNRCTASNLLIFVRKKFPSNKIIFANGGDRSDTSKILEYDIAQEFDIELKFGIGGNHKESSSSDLLGRWEEYIKNKTKFKKIIC